jgi:hypothetical protein
MLAWQPLCPGTCAVLPLFPVRERRMAVETQGAERPPWGLPSAGTTWTCPHCALPVDIDIAKRRVFWAIYAMATRWPSSPPAERDMKYVLVLYLLYGREFGVSYGMSSPYLLCTYVVYYRLQYSSSGRVGYHEVAFHQIAASASRHFRRLRHHC